MKERRGRGTLRLALAFAALLAALVAVVWRQSRALEALRALDETRRQRAVAEAGRMELLARIQQLESRARVVAAARDRLGLRVPTAAEIVILPLAPPVAVAAPPLEHAPAEHAPGLLARP
ncbi:MAG: hypothetical protein HY561_00355 [Gemmatimonadetes bacterium]|nr:hypothetical protein [Gemmatimonadota bacterium]